MSQEHSRDSDNLTYFQDFKHRQRVRQIERLNKAITASVTTISEEQQTNFDALEILTDPRENVVFINQDLQQKVMDERKEHALKGLSHEVQFKVLAGALEALEQLVKENKIDTMWYINLDSAIGMQSIPAFHNAFAQETGRVRSAMIAGKEYAINELFQALGGEMRGIPSHLSYREARDRRYAYTAHEDYRYFRFQTALEGVDVEYRYSRDSSKKANKWLPYRSIVVRPV